MSDLFGVEELFGQWLEASSPEDKEGVEADDAALLAELSEVIPESGEVDDGSWTEFEAVIERYRAAALAAADEVRRSCQMTGQAVVNGVMIRPNGEFICQSGTPEVKARSLKGWPSSPSWFVILSQGDHEAKLDGSEVGSWWQVVQAARELAADWRADDARTERAYQATVQRAEAELRAAYAQVAEKRTALNLVRRDGGGADVDVEPELVAAFRHRIGLTLDELARELGVNPRTTRAWVQGRSKPRDWFVAEMNRLLVEHDNDVRRYLDHGCLPESRPQGWQIAVIAAALPLHTPPLSSQM